MRWRYTLDTDIVLQLDTVLRLAIVLQLDIVLDKDRQVALVSVCSSTPLPHLSSVQDDTGHSHLLKVLAVRTK